MYNWIVAVDRFVYLAIRSIFVGGSPMTIDAYLEKNNGIVHITDLTHCLEILRDFHNVGYLFRGHEDVDYHLVTTMDRYGGNFKWQRERFLMREFSRRIHHYLPYESMPKTTLELLSLMQHYGVPTRLLDFTKSPFIALYFAVNDILRDKDAAVWALLPHNIRRATLKRIREKDEELVKGIGSLVNPFSEFTRESLFAKWFMADKQSIGFHEIVRHYEIIMDVEPLMMNNRLTVQQGLFLVSGSSCRTFEETLVDLLTEIQTDMLAESTDPTLAKIIIPKNLRLPLLKELESMNINASSLFDGLEGFARFLRESIVTKNGLDLAPYLWEFEEEEK